jgi:hypothetical protein
MMPTPTPSSTALVTPPQSADLKPQYLANQRRLRRLEDLRTPAAANTFAGRNKLGNGMIGGQTSISAAGQDRTDEYLRANERAEEDRVAAMESRAVESANRAEAIAASAYRPPRLRPINRPGAKPL